MATRHTQQIILDTAVELFNAWGTPEVSTNRIAAFCGVSRGHLHYHFHTKQDLVQCILMRITAEMTSSWREDLLHPNLVRLAEMFGRQALLTHRYRFFFREQSYLLRSDPLLLRRYRELTQRRVGALEEFFLELDRRSALRLQGNRELARSLVRGTWIIADNWLNSVEFLEPALTLESIQAGYELILDIFRPYLEDERRVRKQSRTAIQAQIASRETLRATPSRVVTLPAATGQLASA
jgi:AcrR family transcriptional regulator